MLAETLVPLTMFKPSVPVPLPVAVPAQVGLLPPVSFIQAPVEEKLQELGYADVMIIDPPRKGVDQKGLDTLFQMMPEKIIYSSCKPATMARDIRFLSEKYDVSEIHLVDMFPQTHHVELLCLLKKKI